MGQRPGSKNIQIQCKQDFYELFEDTFQQSGANSKAEFARTLIDNYLNPEENADKATKEKEKLAKEFSLFEAEALNDLKSIEKEKEELSNRLALYETDEMKAILKKHKGEKLVLNNYQGKRVSIEINDLPDVFFAIFNSVKIK